MKTWSNVNHTHTSEGCLLSMAVCWCLSHTTSLVLSFIVSNSNEQSTVSMTRVGSQEKGKMDI